ncbi:hypothetical protein SDC9_199356 [bioreactor metagenome]|uniref:Uncharacterized protein n=1 Tax=bioreactor metagenome TaxID=1076179 RepID=A0A645IKB7_9ZZZZ
MPRGVNRAGWQRRAAVMAQNHVLIGQIVKIAANRLRADGEMLHQLFSTDVSLFFYQLDDRVMSLCLLHYCSLKFCRMR